MSFRTKIPAKEWKEIMEQKKLAKKIPSKFLFRRHTCGICQDGIKFRTAWKWYHEDEGEGGYGSYTYVFSYICKQCAPTREQLVFMSLNFKRDMPKYQYTKWYM